MTRPTYQWTPGQQVIRTELVRSTKTETVATIEGVTRAGRAKIADETFMPDGSRVGDATAALDSRSIRPPPKATIAPATKADIARVERAAHVAQLQSRIRAEVETFHKFRMTSDPARLEPALEKLVRAMDLLRDGRLP
jgi:hypothetical protein